MDFHADIMQIAKNMLDYYEVGYNDLSDDRQIIGRWVNVQLKLIRPEARNVVKSPKVTILSDPDTSTSLSLVEEKFRKGENVNPHLSKSIFQQDYTDYLFSDWGIYHLHLSTVVEGKYFMKRSNNLLFVMIRQQEVYFIDVRPHDEQWVFAQKALLQIVHDEWPHILERFKLKGIVGLEREIDDPGKIAMMRKSGMNALHRIGNDYYAPMGGGITTAGTSLQVTIEVDKLYRMVRNAMDHVQKNQTDIAAKIGEAIGTFPSRLDFHLELTENGFFILERNSNCGFPINQ
jgi:hypothetical protein